MLEFSDIKFAEDNLGKTEDGQPVTEFVIEVLQDPNVWLKSQMPCVIAQRELIRKRADEIATKTKATPRIAHLIARREWLIGWLASREEGGAE